MDQEFGSQIIRSHEYVDLYVTEKDQRLIHYFSNPTTQGQYIKEYLGNDVVSRPGVIRQGDAIDVYYVNKKHELIHHCVGQWSGWRNHFECLDKNVADKKPACVRHGDYIDVYYWRDSGELIHRHVSVKTNWKYTQPKIIAKGGGSSLCAINNSRQNIDVYFQQNGWLHHMKTGEYMGKDWIEPVKYMKFPRIKQGSPTKIVKSHNNNEVFYLTNDNRICQIISDPKSKQYLKFKRYVNGEGPDNNEFAVVRIENQTDIYFVRNSQVYHTYSGVNNGWVWIEPEVISDNDADYGLCAIRTKQSAIDLYYISKTGSLRHLSIGEGTDLGKSQYQYIDPSALQRPKHISHRRIIDLKDLKSLHQFNFFAQGWNANAYTALIHGVYYIVKIFKRPKAASVQKQMKFLQRLNSVQTGILFGEVTQNDYLVGFVMKKFEGVTIDNLFQSQKLSSKQKMEIIISFAQAVKNIQELGICHSDIHVRNLLVFSENHVKIIDYGNAILFDQDTLTRSDLTGTDFLRPPEYFKGPYCPVGVNAFQFARIAMNIWTQVSYKKFWTLKDSTEEIESIHKDRVASMFFQPIIELLDIKNPFERIISQKLIESLKSVLKSCQKVQIEI